MTRQLFDVQRTAGEVAQIYAQLKVEKTHSLDSSERAGNPN
jgi:hypothetical protein